MLYSAKLKYTRLQEQLLKIAKRKYIAKLPTI